MKEEIEQQLRKWAERAAQRALRDPPPSLNILVWGPNLNRLEDARERRQLQDKRATIVQELRTLGHAATTSEELIEFASTRPGLAGIATQPVHYVEARQLDDADLIIVLLGPPGSVAEVAGLLARERSLVKRSAIFYDEDQWAGGYVDRGPLEAFKALGRDWPYDREDLVSCRVIESAVNVAADLAESLKGTIP